MTSPLPVYSRQCAKQWRPRTCLPAATPNCCPSRSPRPGRDTGCLSELYDQARPVRPTFWSFLPGVRMQQESVVPASASLLFRAPDADADADVVAQKQSVRHGQDAGIMLSALHAFFRCRPVANLTPVRLHRRVSPAPQAQTQTLALALAMAMAPGATRPAHPARLVLKVRTAVGPVMVLVPQVCPSGREGKTSASPVPLR